MKQIVVEIKTHNSELVSVTTLSLNREALDHLLCKIREQISNKEFHDALKRTSSATESIMIKADLPPLKEQKKVPGHPSYCECHHCKTYDHIKTRLAEAIRRFKESKNQLQGLIAMIEMEEALEQYDKESK